MSLQIQKLRDFQKELDKLAKQEIEAEVIQFVKSTLFQNDFISSKSRKETKQSARVLNNWEKEGLIDKINPEEGKFRTYNKAQGIWLDIVTVLREFGFPLDKIKRVKELLLDSRLEKRFSPLEYGLMHSVLVEPIILVIYKDANISLLSQNQYRDTLPLTAMAPHLHFNLLNLADNEFPYNNFNLIGKGPQNSKLSSNELAVLYFIRTGDFESIKIKLKEGDIYLLEGTKKISNKSKITDIINKGDFMDIEVKTQNGQIVHLSSTQKIKL